MAYIGKSIESGTFKVLDTSGNTYNGSNTTFSLGTQVGSAAQLLVSHDGVIQKPGTDYTLASSGASITFSTAPASGASIFIVEISGAVGGTVTPSDTSVTADKLNTALLTGHTDIGANIADADLFLIDDGAGGTLRKTAASRLKTYAGFTVADITGATALDATPADTDEFIFSDAGTLKRIDYSYIKGSDNTPFFRLARTSDQTGISDNSNTQVQFNSIVFDSDSACTLGSSYDFTVPSGEGGKYLLSFSAMLSSGSNNNANDLNILGIRTRSGSDTNIAEIEVNGHNGWGRGATVNNHGIFDLQAGDKITMKVQIDTVDGGNGVIAGSNAKTYMSGCKVG